MTFYNLSEFASLYPGELARLNLSLDLTDEVWQRLNATAYSYLEGPGAPLHSRVAIITVYLIIFIAGVVGNVSTCIVIVQNRCMHTATNYYLFSLAVSDLILLLSGLPPEVFRVWNPKVYIFGEPSCVLLGLASEMSANATVLTITAFTVERYIAICHPFLSHTMSKLSRVVKFIVTIWMLALCLAVPQAIQFGVVHSAEETSCTVKWQMVEHAFEISGFVFFVGPMTVITVLYLLIAIKLRSSRLLLRDVKRGSLEGGEGRSKSYRSNVAQSRAIKMLVAVAVSFFLCWAPFHSQRLLAVYGESLDPSDTLSQVYELLTDISGLLYFLSTAINPFLYNIMSNKFRTAFKTTIAYRCCGRSHHIRRTTRCATRRSPLDNNKRTRIPSTNTHLTTLTTYRDTRGGVPPYGRSISAVLVGRGGKREGGREGRHFKHIRRKLKRGTLAMFSRRGEEVRGEEGREGEGEAVSLSSKTSISNSSVQGVEGEGREMATFMEKVNTEIII